MRQALALILVISMVTLARHLGGDGGGRFATMALGFVLIVAALIGEAIERVGLPRLTTYLFIGLYFGPSMLNLITPAMSSQLSLVNGLAVALIAFGAGMELDVTKLRADWRNLLRHGGLIITLLFVSLFLVVLAATPFLPVISTTAWPLRIGIALVGAAVLTSFSPTVAMAVLAETRARGPLADRVVQMVVMADLGVILLFTFGTTTARMLEGSSLSLLGTIGQLSWEIAGSLAIGLSVGAGVYAYRRFVNRRTGLVLLGLCLVLAEVGSRVGLSPLLSCLAAGFVARNSAPEAAHEMDELLHRVRLPVLIVFFAAAGTSFHLDQLRTVGLVALAFVVVRLGFIVLWNRVAAKFAAFPSELARFVPCGLVSQAGVTLGLAVIVGREFGEWGKVLETLFVAVISLHEIIGPVAFRWALNRAGEIPTPEVTLPPVAVGQG